MGRLKVNSCKCCLVGQALPDKDALVIFLVQMRSKVENIRGCTLEFLSLWQATLIVCCELFFDGCFASMTANCS